VGASGRRTWPNPLPATINPLLTWIRHLDKRSSVRDAPHASNSAWGVFLFVNHNICDIKKSLDILLCIA